MVNRPSLLPKILWGAWSAINVCLIGNLWCRCHHQRHKCKFKITKTDRIYLRDHSRRHHHHHQFQLWSQKNRQKISVSWHESFIFVAAITDSMLIYLLLVSNTCVAFCMVVYETTVTLHHHHFIFGRGCQVLEKSCENVHKTDCCFVIWYFFPWGTLNCKMINGHVT